MVFQDLCLSVDVVSRRAVLVWRVSLSAVSLNPPESQTARNVDEKDRNTKPAINDCALTTGDSFARRDCSLSNPGFEPPGRYGRRIPSKARTRDRPSGKSIGRSCRRYRDPSRNRAASFAERNRAISNGEHVQSSNRRSASDSNRQG